MSHNTKAKTSMIDLECIKKALEEMGVDTKLIKENVMMKGYLDADIGMMDLVVRKGVTVNRYDIGFKKEEDGSYSFSKESMDRDVREGSAWSNGFNNKYAGQWIKKSMTESGLDLAWEEETEDGKRVFEFESTDSGW